MKNADVSVSDAPAPGPPRSYEAEYAHRLASEIKSRWNDGDCADARAVLTKYSSLLNHKSVVLDLAYEEYCQRMEAGEAVEPAEFCQRFPQCRESLRRLIDIHRYLEQNPHLIPEPPVGQWPQAGETILGFHLLEELGRGAFARVFLATELALGQRQVAVKIARHGAAEAETLGRLDHPNIVPVNSLQVDQPSGLTAICMPYLGRTTLCDVLVYAFGKPQIPERSGVILDAVRTRHSQENWSGEPDPLLRRRSYSEGVVHLIQQLADALAYAHSRGVCHCDLKPSNVLVTPLGRPMLLDFNLCLDERNSVKESWGGTVPYMSPEQLLAMRPDAPSLLSPADARSDVFSLGVILYELLCGTLPFGPIPRDWTLEKIRDDLLARQRAGPRPLPRTVQVDQQLTNLLQRCLAFDARTRPQSAAELAEALRSVLSFWRRSRRWVRARKKSVLGVAAAVLAVLATGGYQLAHRDPYSVRQLKYGIDAYRHESFREAIKYLSRASDADPALADALFMRGRAHQRLGDVHLALDDYQAAAQLRSDGPTLACIGYCNSVLEFHNEAIWNYKAAAAIGSGFDRAALLNNLAFSSAREGRVKDARLSFDEAIALNPALQAAYYNRASFEFQWALQKSELPPESTVQDVEMAIRLGPVTAQLFCDAARIYAVAARSHSELIPRSLNYLQRAIDLGQDPRPLRKDNTLHAIRGAPEFVICLDRPAVDATPAQPVRILDPIVPTAD